MNPEITGASGQSVCIGGLGPVRACPMEVVGAEPFRTKVKRRKACGVGKSACSDEAQYLSVLQVYWRRDGSEV